MIHNFKLGELFEIQIGKTPARGDKKMWDLNKKSNNIWLSIRDLNQTDANGYISDSAEYITDDGAKLVKIIPKNTLLLSFKLTLGRTAITKIPLRTNEAIAALLPKTDQCDIRYLKYYFEYFNFVKFAGNDFKVKGLTLNKKKLAVIPIPVPSLQEQEKIIERLDKVIENIRNKVDKESNSIELYGKLYKSKLNQIFNNEFMGSGETELGELSEIISGQSPKGEFINDSEGLEFHQGKKAFSDKFLLDSGKRTQYTTKQIPKNTIVMSVRAPVGPVNITQESICIGRGLAGIIPKESNLDFLFYYLDSIKEENTGHIGATINSINRNEIMKIKIPNVSIAKQETIANQIEQVLELKNELVSNSREVLTKLNKLKESVLSKEFSYE